MKKGTALLLAFGASMADAIDAVKAKYADKRASASGWHGTAVVNVAAGEGEDESAVTYLVKGIKNGWEVYKLAGRVIDEVVVKSGEFEEV